MNEYIKAAWTTEKEEDFDIKSFALSILEIAKRNLEKDKELVATAFMVTGSQIQCFSVDFVDHQEKVVAYKQLVEAARKANALALVTCNDAYVGGRAGPEYLESYYPGKLAAEGARECLMLTVSGPAMQTWCVDVPYDRLGDEIVFAEHSESLGEDVGFLEDWPEGSIKVQ